MQELTFKVKGSSADPYEVIFIKDGKSLTALCNCPAGQFGNLCKHRLSILDGKTGSICSDNSGDVATVRSWLPGTDVEAALIELRKVEADSNVTRQAVADAKKKLARAMNS